MKKIALLWLNLLWLAVAYGQQSGDEPMLVIDQKGHSAIVRDVLFTSDRKTLISVGDDKTIRFWDVASGELRDTWRGYVGEGAIGKLNAVALTADDRILAVAGYLPDNEIRLINLSTKKQIGTLTGHSKVITDLAFSKDGRYLASASGDNSIKVWQIPSLNNHIFSSQPQQLCTLKGHQDAVFSLAFSNDGARLVSGGADKRVLLWQFTADMKGASILKVMNGHENVVTAVDYSRQNSIVSGSYDGKLIFWKSSGEIDLVEDVGNKIFTVSFTADGRRAVAVTSFGKGGVYEAPLWGKSGIVFNKHTNTVTASKSAPFGETKDKEIMATAGGEFNEIFIWSPITGKELRKMVGKGRTSWAAAFGKGYAAAIGQTVSNKGDNNKGNLEKVFDFETLTLDLKTPDPANFQRAQEVFNNKKLVRSGTDTEVLKIGGKTALPLDPKIDRSLRCYTFTPDGRVVVGSAASLKLFDQQANFVREFVGHTGEIWAVAIAQDGRTLISASGDQTYKLWNIESGENLATLFVGADNEWVCWTNKGYYEASAGGEKYIGWHVNRGKNQLADFYPVSSFNKQYHQPEIVRMTIRMGNEQKALQEFKANEKFDPSKDITQQLPPVIDWLTPEELDNQVTTASIRIKVRVTSDSPIEKIKLLVNGRAYNGSRGFVPSKDDTPTQKYIEAEVNLTEKINRLQVYAQNQFSYIASEEVVVEYQASAPAQQANNEQVNQQTTQQPTQQQPADESEAEELGIDVASVQNNYIQKPNLYVLSIGISEYANPAYNLGVADDDARSIAAMYRKQEGKLYNKVFVNELIDKNATRAKILDGFRWIEKNVTQKDFAIIFIGSHGVNFENGFYILPHDGKPVSAEQLRATCVNWKDFSLVLSNLPCKVLLFLDACQSGSLGGNVGIPNNTEALRQAASEDVGVVIMSAATGTESALENPAWGHGAFTLALLEGMEKGLADIVPDNIVNLRELDLFVSERVIGLTQNKQHPTTQKPSTISVMPIVEVVR